MDGFELRLWRKSMGWSQERAAEELGVVLRTYQSYEKRKEVPKVVILATKALSLSQLWPDVANTLKQLSTIARH